MPIQPYTAPETPDLSILIVAWNVRDDLCACLQSIRSSVEDPPLRVEVIVVDSASADGTGEMIERDYPAVHYLPHAENIGFTRGNNLALQTARGRFLLLLNPDTLILGAALQTLTAYLEAHPTVGIVGPQTLNTDGSHQSTRRRFPTLLTAFFESTWLQPFAPRRLLDRYYVRDLPDEAAGAVDWVQGSALMARREVYTQIGGLDEGYIMYSEEMDWCQRARAAGWGVAYLGAARIIHHGGRSTEQVRAASHVYFQQSKIRYFRKVHGRPSAWLLRTFLILIYGQQVILEGLKGLVGHKRPLRRERVRLYWQVIRALSGV